ncbi:hypothetical protein MKZ26_17825 [Sporosarcina sp. FSL K6-6792]|uniref:hypothetical protein n=1 Tax=Sporosarcina sp. FSL K6-6792 TaxID=2921559 RepID=UPI0030F59731
MKTDIKKIYDLLNSPILTPYNLLENVKLDNYSYVNYYKGEQGVICEMECTSPEKEVAKYYYFFDINDHLFKVNMQVAGFKKIEVFNRDSELQSEISKYTSHPSNDVHVG